MGSCDISIELKGKATKTQIEQAFKRQRDADREENGHAQGYSGDFQTVRRIDLRLTEVFNSYNEAMEYCLKHASKWDAVVAVYYKDTGNYTLTKRETTKEIELSKEKCKLGDERNALQNTPINRSKPFQTCNGCKSRIALAHVKGVNCPVCGVSLRPKRLVAKIATLNNRIQKIIDKQSVINTNAKVRAAAKCKEFRTLIAGWGAC